MPAFVVVIDPVVISSESMNDKRPVRLDGDQHHALKFGEISTHIVARLQAGFHEPGWKSDIEKQILLSGWKRPDGVIILIPGGLKGYSAGNRTTP